MKPTVALIISTYNWPEALEVCFNSIIRQTSLPDEIIVADDGSGKDTRMLVQKYAAIFPINIKHVWHDDKGFRLAEIRNRAILESESDYLIFIDGDIILNREFISDHVHFSTKDHFLTGSRVLINERLTNNLLEGSNFHFRFFSTDFTNRLNGIRTLKLADFYHHQNKSINDLRGCNMSFWKNDLLLVDGFDQQFTGWGREDSDLAVRLMNAGKMRLKLKFAAVQYHLYHPQKSKELLGQNDRFLVDSIINKRVGAVKGISSLRKYENF